MSAARFVAGSLPGLGDAIREGSLTERPGSPWVSLENNHIRGTITAAFLHDVKLHPLPLLQGTAYGRLRERREVDEYVGPGLGLNKAVALRVVEPFYNTGHH